MFPHHTCPRPYVQDFMAGVLVHCMVLDIALQLCSLTSREMALTFFVEQIGIPAISQQPLHHTYTIVLLGTCSYQIRGLQNYSFQ